MAMFYTGKGDKGRTYIFACSKKISKNSSVVEALGSVDELNSLLGVCGAKAKRNRSFKKILEEVQNDLFSIQAEIAGAKKSLNKLRTRKIEELIDDIEKKLPKIKSFVMSGGTELASLLDYARAVARRAERRLVGLGSKKISMEAVKYMNRLSSLLFAMARLENSKNGVKEKKPRY